MVKSQSIDLARRIRLVAVFGLLAIGAGLIAMQNAAAQTAGSADIARLSASELDELVGPIALYPDDLVAIVLPAATYPLQIVQAARFIDARASDGSLTPQSDWDDSVVALLNYPQIVELMNDDLDWTWALGEAVINQRADVLDAIQGFRDRAYAAGNLRSDDRQVVSNDSGVIAIAPADPEVIYIPYYEPRRVVVYQSVPVYHYHPWAYPVYFYPYPAGYAFRTGFFWGVTTAYSIGWHSHYLHAHPFSYHAHPYYGRRYYDPFYVRRNVNVSVNVNVHRAGYVWEPSHRRAARPFVHNGARRVDAGTPTVRAGEGYRYRSAQRPETRSFANPNGTQQPQRNRAPNAANAPPSRGGIATGTREQRQPPNPAATVRVNPRSSALTRPNAESPPATSNRQPAAPTAETPRYRTNQGAARTVESQRQGGTANEQPRYRGAPAAADPSGARSNGRGVTGSRQQQQPQQRQQQQRQQQGSNQRAYR